MDLIMDINFLLIYLTIFGAISIVLIVDWMLFRRRPLARVIIQERPKREHIDLG